MRPRRPPHTGARPQPSQQAPSSREEQEEEQEATHLGRVSTQAGKTDLSQVLLTPNRTAWNMRRRRHPRQEPPLAVDQPAPASASRLWLAALLLLALAAPLAGPQWGASASLYPFGGGQRHTQSIAEIQASLAAQLQVFNGQSGPANGSLHSDANHFKLLERANDFVLVGAR